MSLHNPACFASHMGLWLMEPRRFGESVHAIRSGLWQAAARRRAEDKPETAEEDPGFIVEDGVAIISLQGSLMKGWSKYGGTSTVDARKQLRQANAREDVREILLQIDSPGGHVAGTQTLADEVRASAKPVHAHIDDLGASAAYWVASQAKSISANRTAEIGSIGVVAVVWDESKSYEMDGVKTHVISTGAYKGAFAPGAEVRPEHLAELQRQVDAINAHFLGAILEGRGSAISEDRLKLLADGRTFLADQAQKDGLIDHVRSMDETLAAIRAARSSKSGRSNAERRMRAAKVAADLFTATDMASSLGAPVHRVKYLIRTRNIAPVGQAAHTHLYDRTALNAVRRELRVISALR